ncbi:MAG: hypothetical protein ACOC2Y_06330 [Spirochaetota bacterium]
MRLRNRTTREVFDAHWEIPSSTEGEPILIADIDGGPRPIPKALADEYILFIATLKEMRIGVDHGYTFHP